MELVKQLLIALLTTSLGSILTYLAAIRKSKDEIKAVEIKAENEIKKIESEYQKQIEKIKVETDEQIKLKMAEIELKAKADEDNIKTKYMDSFVSEFMNNPQQAFKKFQSMQNVAKKFPKTKK